MYVCMCMYGRIYVYVSVCICVSVSVCVCNIYMYMYISCCLSIRLCLVSSISCISQMCVCMYVLIYTYMYISCCLSIRLYSLTYIYVYHRCVCMYVLIYTYMYISCCLSIRLYSLTYKYITDVMWLSEDRIMEFKMIAGFVNYKVLYHLKGQKWALNREIPVFLICMQL